MILGYKAYSKAEVDADTVRTSAGAAIVKLAHNTFWGGYSGYFKDTDARPNDPTIAWSSKPADDHDLYAWASRY